MESQVLNLQRVQALETWLEATKTKLTQVNGQRKYGGPPEDWHGPTPGEGCEIYISQIPRDTYEDLLIPLCSSVGPLWEFRLMMNFSGQNRGFAYAKYSSPAVASDAVHQLHNHMLEPGVCLNVRRSTEKRQLVIGELPATTRQEDLLKVLQGLAEGVKWLSLKIEPGLKGVSAIVAFSAHHTASMAKKRLVEVFKKQFNLTITVKWHSSLVMSPKEPWEPQKPSRCLSLPVKPPRHSPKCLPPSPLPDPPTPILQGFCRAVTRPTAKQQPLCSLAASSHGDVLSTTSSVTVLGELCKAAGVGKPLYELYFSHTGQDRIMYFYYRVTIPGTAAPYKGLVPALLGPRPSTVLEQAREAAAQQVLKRVYKQQLDQ
ncbi:dead end protein 1 [Betta splendens]|uniref:Dead end protein 1 n=1 Tax=Betta splendens TaxID=158456 RepID=A0A6P7NPL9_BETSP|nr:dead end protein 1 [Betta splendens]